MPLKFKCDVCQEDIFVKYLKPGEISKCRACGASNTVPDDAEQTGSIPEDYRSHKTQAPAIEDASHLRKRLEKMEAKGIKKLSGLSTTLYIFLTLIILLLLATVIMEAIFYLQIFGPESFVNVDAAIATATIVDTLGLLFAMAFLISSIFFLIWFYRAHKNLRLAGVPGMEHQSFWTVIGCLIPFVNLVMPYVMLRETWKGSRILAGEIPAEKTYDIISDPKIKVWFALVIISGVMSGIDSALVNSEEFTMLQAGVILWIIGDSLYAIAGILLLLIVHQITEFQDKARRLGVYESTLSHNTENPEENFPGAGQS